MFTGIIKKSGIVKKIIANKKEIKIGVKSSLKLENKDLGLSINCAGVCLTVTEVGAGWFRVLASKETLENTTIGSWEGGSLVNLERALCVGDELGGHFVTGHIDGTLCTKNLLDSGTSLEIQFGMEPWVRSYIARKGSVAIDGVSLTINEVRETVFSVNVIPHTQKVTTLGNLVVGKMVNVEVDMFARYLEAALSTTKSTVS